jgi:hypothetical protein
MADIHQSATGESVRFMAGSPKGDDWMRARCESIDVSFNLPSEAEAAKAFRDSLIAAKLTITNL